MMIVLMGGNSSERAISLQSGGAIFAALKSQNIACATFDWQGDNLRDLWQQSFDKVFIAVHGRGGEDGFIQQQLSARNIPFTGTGASASKRCMSKHSTKNIWHQHQLPLAPWAIARRDLGMLSLDASNLNELNLKFPLPWAVKPDSEGSSIGISKVEDLNALNDALALAWKYDDIALIERWIEGAEYTVAILDGEPLPVVRIDCAQHFYDYEAKYHSDRTQYQVPCGLSAALELALQNIALRAFEVLGARGWGRIDFILDADQIPYLLEINTVPGMTEHSLVPMAAKAAGMSFQQLVERIART